MSLHIYILKKKSESLLSVPVLASIMALHDEKKNRKDDYEKLSPYSEH